MKLLGVMLVLLAGTMCGCTAAGRLKFRANQCRILRQLVTMMVTELRTALPLIPDLLRSLAALPDFSALQFLQNAAQRAECFPQCWTDALAADNTLSDDARAVLETVGQTLGSTALDGQLAALQLCLERLNALQSEAEHISECRGHLCRSMGVLGALFFSILLL